MWDARQAVSEIYFELAYDAIRQEMAGVPGAAEMFQQYNAQAWKWQRHAQWVEARQPKVATPHYMDDY